jgi:hypothetical protein
MTDLVLISLIAAVPSTIAAIGSVVSVFIGVQHSKQIAETQQTVATLETNTNSKMTELVNATKKISFQEGGDSARADMKIGAESTEGKGSGKA